MPADFSGYATKSNVPCSDGRTILPNAFPEADGARVPLVWQHGHSDVNNVLGHAILEVREDGVYANGYFNETESAKNARLAVQNKDITSMSIYANRLQQDGNLVKHGIIREVSLVLSGANPEARIENVYIQHSDGFSEEREDEVVIYAPEQSLIHEDGSDGNSESSESSDSSEEGDAPTVADVLDSMTDEQRDVVEYLIGRMAADEDEESDNSDDEESSESERTPEGANTEMSHNVFEKNGDSQKKGSDVLSHSEFSNILADAEQTGSLKQSVLKHVESKGYGIDNIEFLFPDAQTMSNSPDMITRNQDWVTKVFSEVRKTPFSRIRNIYANLTFDEARARGYITGDLKKEEYFGLAKRETAPTTIYKKQRLDRDDIIDVTTMDVVAWLWGEMRVMLNEEIARAILLGDNRAIDDPSKIDETKIRPIAFDHEFFTHRVGTDNAMEDPMELIKAIIRARRYYKGSGQPTLFVGEDFIASILTATEDMTGNFRFRTIDEVASVLRVSSIQPVEFLNDATQKDKATDRTAGLLAVMVNLADYTIGTDRGGEITKFDDFDIDFNQYTYLIEGRMSGSLTKTKSAMTIWDNATAADPVEGENIMPADFSQQIDPRSNHIQFQGDDRHARANQPPYAPTDPKSATHPMNRKSGGNKSDSGDGTETP